MPEELDHAVLTLGEIPQNTGRPIKAGKSVINFDLLPDSLLESWQISRRELAELRKPRD